MGSVVVVHFLSAGSKCLSARRPCRVNWPSMKRLSWLILPLLAASCGGDSEPVTYASPALAAEAGAQALAGGDLVAAAAAFEQAAAATEPAAKAEALTGLFQAQLKGGTSAQAIGAVNRLVQEGGAALTATLLKSLTDSAILERNAEVADAVINLALAKFPDAKQDFAKAVAAVDKLKTQGAGADLSSLGYTGD